MLMLELGYIEEVLAKRRRRMEEETGIKPRYYTEKRIKQPVIKPMKAQVMATPTYSWWDNLLWSLRKGMTM